jgi:outer membrane protein OmpA-like peptidoglycan-associated protein
MDKIKDKANKKLEKNVDKAVDKALDKTEEKANNAINKTDKPEGVEEKSEVDNQNNPEESTNNVKPDETPKLTSYTKYDFVPGDQILFYEDFSQDAIGDFPALWTTNGSGEVRTLNKFPGNWFFLNGADNVYCLMKDLVLPANYIFEFDVVPVGDENGSNSSFYLSLFKSNESEFLTDVLYPGDAGFEMTFNQWFIEAKGYNNQVEGNGFTDGRREIELMGKENLKHVIVWVQGRRLRMYLEGQKILDLPTLIPAGFNFNRLRYSRWGQEGYSYITNIRFSTTQPDTRSKLLTEGKLVSYGMYFDSGKDVVKPESYGALSEIAKVLKENPDVKISIVGHTDSDGNDETNLDLSKRRAANVKNALVKDFAISGDRITTDGKGEKAPIAANDKPENKAKNRRVEFLKL